MSELIQWVVVYGNRIRSRTFATRSQAIGFLASQRDMQPDIMCLEGPNGVRVPRETVWQEIALFLKSEGTA
jgi:hypothetical protein